MAASMIGKLEVTHARSTMADAARHVFRNDDTALVSWSSQDPKTTSPITAGCKPRKKGRPDAASRDPASCCPQQDVGAATSMEFRIIR